MRLTLRTLLAYLDDMLEPAEARDMGAKIAESSVAQSLVARIREVLRRRRLMAPDVAGPGMGIDPNLVAEYIDNAIPPADVAEVEKVFLGSDIHLAEVAGTHQILTMFLGDPVQTVPRSRERMYALGPLPQKASSDGAASRVSAIDVSTIDVSKTGATSGAGAVQTGVHAPYGAAAGRTNGAHARPIDNTPPDRMLTDSVVAVPMPAGDASSTRFEVPEYLRSKPAWQRMLAPLVVLALAGVFLWLVADEFNLLDRYRSTGAPDAASAETASAETEVALGAPSDVPGEAALAANSADVPPNDIAPPAEPGTEPLDPETPMTADDVEAVATAKRGDKAASIDPPPPPETGDEAIPVAPPPGEGFKEKPAVAALDKPAEKPSVLPAPPGSKGADAGKPKAAEPADGDTVPLPAKADAVPIDYASNDGVLLNYDARRKGWYLLPRRSALHTGEIIASPEPFDAELSINKGAGTVTVLGGSALTVMGPTDAALYGFDIRPGGAHSRLIFETRKAGDDGADAPMIFAVKVGSGTWKVELRGPDGVCAVEVSPREPDGFEQDLGDNTWTGRLYVTGGSATVTLPSGERVDLETRTALPISPATAGADAIPVPPAPEVNGTSGDGKAVDVPGTEEKPGEKKAAEEEVAEEKAAREQNAEPGQPPATRSVPVSSPAPRWMDRTSSRILTRRYANLFEKEFDLNHTIGETLPALVNDPSFQIAELATHALSLTQHHRSLVRALASSPHKEARLVAITGLRWWLALSPKNGPLLEEELKRNFADLDSVPVLYELLWGYSAGDTRDPVKSEQLVEWLEHEQLAVRELAFYHLHRITGLRYDYDAQSPAAQRSLSANRWKTHLRKEGGALRRK